MAKLLFIQSYDVGNNVVTTLFLVGATTSGTTFDNVDITLSDVATKSQKPMLLQRPVSVGCQSILSVPDSVSAN